MKIKYMLGLAFAALFVSSCTEDQMDTINKDLRHPSTEIVNGKFQLTDGMVSTVYSTLCGAYGWYVSSYTEQLFGTGNNQLKNTELRKLSEIAASSTFNNEWNGTYLNLNNLVLLRKKCQEGGVNAGQYDVLGIEEILEAINWGVLTDLHGDIPFSEAFTGVSAPKVDSQKDVYNHIFFLLDDAKTNLSKAIDAGQKNVGVQDIIYGGDLDKWLALAHAVKARYLLHTYGVNKTNALLTQVVTEANTAITMGFDGANLSVFNGKTADNSWSAYWWSRHYIGSSKTVDDLLVARSDPREAIYNANLLGNNILGVPGDDDMAVATETLNAPAWLENGAAYLHLFSEAEVYFILAEAKARLGQDAKADFEAAVKSSIADYSATGGDIVKAAISDDDVTAYLSGVSALYSANPLKEILVQKYIAQSRDEQIEAFNDIRRCKFIDGSHPVTLTNPKNIQGGASRWPMRLPYGESDVVSNPNVAAAFGSGNDAGLYIFTDPVWWAGGKR